MKIQILKLKDSTDKFVIKKNKTFDIPFRLLIVGKTGSAKSNFLANILLQDNKEFYRKDFDGDRIFIFTGSPSDNKLKIIRKELDIPDENVFKGYDEEAVEVIYDMMVEEFEEALEEKEKPKPFLFIFDDLGFSGSMKGQEKESQLLKIFMNSRKYLGNVAVLVQKYSDAGTGLRENASGLVISKSSNKQIELIEGDHNYIRGKDNKKIFRDMVIKETEKPFSFLIINFNKPDLYYNTEFEPVSF
jgi:hypothetical protein